MRLLHKLTRIPDHSEFTGEPQYFLYYRKKIIQFLAKSACSVAAENSEDSLLLTVTYNDF